MPQVILHEGGNEVVTVVITLLTTQRQGVTDLLRSRLKDVLRELFLQELVPQPLIDQQVRPPGGVFETRDDFSRVILRPLALVLAQVAREGLLAPRHLARCRDGSKGGNRL